MPYPGYLLVGIGLLPFYLFFLPPPTLGGVTNKVASRPDVNPCPPPPSSSQLDCQLKLVAQIDGM